MALPLIPIVIAGATWLSRIGIAVFAINEIKKLLSDNKSTLDEATNRAEAAGLSSQEQQKMSAAVTYEKVEEQGKSPDDFWGSLTPSEQQALKFSPESLRADTQRTTFLGTAQTLLWIGAGVVAGYAAYRGLPVSLKELARITAMRQKNVSASVIANELTIMKTAILNATWVPGTVAGILATGGWIAGGLMNNLNDATLWGRIFLDQAHTDVLKAAEKDSKLGTGSGDGISSADLPKTIIRMVTEEKPKQFIGTLFSSKLGNAEQFERVLDDKITDMKDLEADVKLNLNKWLASLPTRMGYSIVIRKDPVDEYGAQQSGIWATMTMFMTHISGKTTPIDTVLLGPVEPQVRLELQKKTTTVENHVKDFIQAATVKEIQIPSGSVDIFNATGERITPSTVSSGNATVPVGAPVDASAVVSNGITLLKDKDGLIRTGEYTAVNANNLSDNARLMAEDFARKQAAKGTTANNNSSVTSVPESKGTIIKPPQEGELYIVGNTGGEGVNMRIAPSVNATISAKLTDGTKVQFLADEGLREGYNWWSVRRYSDGSRGSIASKFLIKIA